MRFYFVAGEASGDLHGSNLMAAIRTLDPEASFRCWGGSLMEAQGAVVVKHYRDLAFMGFAEVVRHLPAILKNFRLCESDILAFHPDAVILIDYPGFNLRLSAKLSRAGIRVFYYISPQLWAWRSSRVYTIRKHVERMFVILPFEKEFYKRYDYSVDYEGHPLLDVINDDMPRVTRADFLQRNNLSDKPIVALLPGSRKMELAKMLNLMLQVPARFPGFQFVIAAAPSIDLQYYRALTADQDVGVVAGQTYDLLRHAEAALVTSGTATLETALMGVPQIVCYRGSTLSYFIARQIVKVKYISLVNLIADQPLLTELIQHDFNLGQLTSRLNSILSDPEEKKRIRDGYARLKMTLGGPGASMRIAKKVMQYLKPN